MFHNKKNWFLFYSNHEYKSYQKYHKWIKEQQKFIIPNKTKFDKDNILYDIKSNTIDYLKCFVYIGKEIEKLFGNNSLYTKRIGEGLSEFIQNIIDKSIKLKIDRNKIDARSESIMSSVYPDKNNTISINKKNY